MLRAVLGTWASAGRGEPKVSHSSRCQSLKQQGLCSTLRNAGRTWAGGAGPALTSSKARSSSSALSPAAAPILPGSERTGRVLWGRASAKPGLGAHSFFLTSGENLRRAFRGDCRGPHQSFKGSSLTRLGRGFLHIWNTRANLLKPDERPPVPKTFLQTQRAEPKPQRRQTIVGAVPAMFASLQHRRKLDEATSSTDDVTPGDV